MIIGYHYQSGLIITYFIFFTVAILLAQVTNFVISNLIALPILFLVTNSLINTAGFLPRRITKSSRSLTQIGIMLPFIALVNLIIASFLGTLALVLASTVTIVYLAALSLVAIRKITDKSITIEQIEERIVAGTHCRPAGQFAG